MSRSLTISLKRPHEYLGLPMPMMRRFADRQNSTWIVFLLVALLACVAVYVYQVNAAASKSFELRLLEKRVERLQDTVASLHDHMTELKSIHSLEERIQGMGYVSMMHVRYIDTGLEQLAARQ